MLALLVLTIPVGTDALVDDFEEDFWLPFTHFNLGDRASAGYVNGIARSGDRSYRVAIDGWSLRNFGSAYGYAIYAIRGSPVGRLQVSVLHASLGDSAPGPSDAFAAGIALELLDAQYRTLRSMRYVTAYKPSVGASRCAPTQSDVVLARIPPMGGWQDVGRNPVEDFPAAPWGSSEFVKVSIGFLCAAGLTGASYSLYFDDFAMDSGRRDTDGDGLEDLEEESRFHVVEIRHRATGTPIPQGGPLTLDFGRALIRGQDLAAAIQIDLTHPRPRDLSISLAIEERSYLLWDPGFHSRSVAVLGPSYLEEIRGEVLVEVGISEEVFGGVARLYVDEVLVGGARRAGTETFTIPWSTDAWTEGPHAIVVAAALDPQVGFFGFSESVLVIVDRTAPDLRLERPLDGATLRGLAVIEAQAYDANGVEAVELWVDGVRVDVRDAEPYVFVFDTLDLTNAGHTVEVRARDGAGNEARLAADVTIRNDAVSAPLPCLPTCSLSSGTTTGNLPPIGAAGAGRELLLMDGNVLRTSELQRVPWRPRADVADPSVSLVLDLFRGRDRHETDGVVGLAFDPGVLGVQGTWRVLVQDHGSMGGGSILRASVWLASRSSAGRVDTDFDRVPDGVERAGGLTNPVLPDSDADGLVDGFELETHSIEFSIDGAVVGRIVRTDPLDPDTDDDGLSDGSELLPGEGLNATDPSDPDTDDDMLLDGTERNVHGSDPTLRDTDRDSLSDYDEVTPRSLAMEVDGIAVVRSIVTSPLSPDTDLDGFHDGEEWDGVSLYGFLTDPTDPDTDRDGLSDLDEVTGFNRRPTNPVRSDTDGDGLGDGLDLSPTELWAFPWRSTFEPGAVRFTQRFGALGVHGLFAGIFTHVITDGTCVFLSDHTAEATRSSDESTAGVLGNINQVLVDGGETNFTATVARDIGQQSFGVADFVYGDCSILAPRQYRIQYIHDRHGHDVDFLNTAEVAMRDDANELFYHASLDIPVRLASHQSVILQATIRADADRGGDMPDGGTVVPGIVYSLVRGRDFRSTAPFYRNLAVGATIDEHAYEFNLRIPKELARKENLVTVDGVPTATLVVMPVWLTASGSNPMKSALNATHMMIGAAITRVSESTELIVTRLATDMQAFEAALPQSSTGFAMGYHSFGGFSVYLHRMGNAFDSDAPAKADAVYLVGESLEEIATFQESIVWDPKDAWVRESEDGFGVFLGIFKHIRRGISLTGQVTANILLPVLSVPPGATEQMSFGRSAFVVTKLQSFETGQPYYVIGETTVDTVKIRVSHPEIPGVMLTEVRTVERGLRSEIVDDLDDSRLLTGTKYSVLKSAIGKAAIGATLVIFGSQAVLAFRDGDLVRGSFYVAAGAVGVFGILKADVELVKGLFRSATLPAGLRIKVGAAAGIAVGGILVGYELLLASQSDDPIRRLSHYESAGAVATDAIISSVPVYGVAAMLGWQIGLGVAIAFQSLLGVVPDALALRIVSSPGTTIVFLFEYVFATEIPSDIAADALIKLLTILADVARLNNSFNPPQPTIVMVP